MDNIVYQLRSAGFAFLRSALPARRVAGLRSAIDDLWSEDAATWGADALEAMGQRGALRNLCDHGRAFEELLMESPVYAVLDTLLGADHVLHSYDGLILFAGQGRFPWDFHTDVMPLCGTAFPSQRTPAVNCLYYLDRVTTENGATWLIPASHHSVATGMRPEELAPFASQAPGDAGDALLFDARLWHCAGENRTDSPRRVIKTEFCQPWLRPQMDYSRAVRQEVRHRLNRRALRLLGIGSTPPASVRELREALAR
jgi:ectoine hydroxylase-related dioxygenase (phytanoyl-CoA dioxygenase family)